MLGFPFGMGEKLTKAMPPPVMGKDMPLDGHVRQGRTRATRRPASSARCIETDPEAKTVFDTALGLENLKRQWGVHAAGVIMSSRAADRHHPDHEARAGRPDRHAVRLPGLRVARPDQDGLPGAAQPHDHRRRARQHRGQPRAPTSCSKTSRSTTQPPTTCSPAATPSACSSSTAGRCAALLRLHEARQLRGHLGRHRAVSAGPDGRELAHQLRPAQERAAGDHADPPRARRVARGHPGHHLRPDHLPGAGDGDRAEGRRLHRSARPTSCAARWARRRSPSSTSSSRASRPACTANGYSDGAVKTLWDILLPFSDYAFNKAHSAAYGVSSLLDRLPQGALSRRVHGGAAHERRRLQGQAGAVPQRVPPHGHQGAAARRERVDRLLRGRRRGHPLRPRRGAQRRRRTSSTAIRRRARREGRASSPSTTSCARCRCRSRTSARSNRSSRPAPSTRWARPGARCVEIHEDAVEAAVKHQAQRGATARSASTSTACTTTPRRRRDRCRTGRSGPRRTSSPSSARCSASTSRTIRSPASRSRSPSTPSTSIPDLLASERSPGRRPGHGRRARHERAAPRRRKQRQPVRHDHGRGLRRRDRP